MTFQWSCRGTGQTCFALTQMTSTGIAYRHLTIEATIHRRSRSDHAQKQKRKKKDRCSDTGCNIFSNGNWALRNAPSKLNLTLYAWKDIREDFMESGSWELTWCDLLWMRKKDKEKKIMHGWWNSDYPTRGLVRMTRSSRAHGFVQQK